MRRFLILAVLAVSGALLIPSAASAAALRFEGFTSQCAPPEQGGGCQKVSGDVASFRNNPRLGAFLIFYDVGCTVPGLTLTGPSGIGSPRVTWTNIPLSKSLKFRASSPYDIDLGQGLRNKGTATVKGKISRKGTGSGTFSDNGVITKAGQPIGNCASGKISWKVRRKK